MPVSRLCHRVVINRRLAVILIAAFFLSFQFVLPVAGQTVDEQLEAEVSVMQAIERSVAALQKAAIGHPQVFGFYLPNYGAVYLLAPDGEAEPSVEQETSQVLVSDFALVERYPGAAAAYLAALEDHSFLRKGDVVTIVFRGALEVRVTAARQVITSLQPIDGLDPTKPSIVELPLEVAVNQVPQVTSYDGGPAAAWLYVSGNKILDRYDPNVHTWMGHYYKDKPELLEAALKRYNLALQLCPAGVRKEIDSRRQIALGYLQAYKTYKEALDVYNTMHGKISGRQAALALWELFAAWDDVRAALEGAPDHQRLKELEARFHSLLRDKERPSEKPPEVSQDR